MMYRDHGCTNLGQSDQGNISHINQPKIGVVESVPKIEESSKVSPPLSYVLRMMSNPILMWLSDQGNISHVNQSNLALVAPAQF